MPRLALLLLCVIVSIPSHLAAENWDEFRGPTGQGHYQGKSLPLEWSTTKNVVWKQAIPGKGWSSPVVHEGRVYLTMAIPMGDPKTPDQSLGALCLDAATGKILWQTEIFRVDGAKTPKIHRKNTHASPSPITDGKRLYVHFGHQGTGSLDLDGKVLWRNTDLGYAPVHGNGGTPILVEGLLVFSADGGDKQFVYALDTSTGKVTWKTPRNTEVERRFSFSTPLLITTKTGRQIVSPASGWIMGYDPADGKEIWRAKYEGGYSVIPRPVFGHGMVFFGTGYNTPNVYAVRTDGTGDVSETHIAWKLAKGAPHTPSLLLVGDELYMVSDKGIASCVGARTGTSHWQERIGGDYSASPTYWNGRVYFQSEEGVTTVVRAAKEFEKLATSKVDEKTFASYAIADGALYLRTETQLYRIQEK